MPKQGRTIPMVRTSEHLQGAGEMKTFMILAIVWVAGFVISVMYLVSRG